MSPHLRRYDVIINGGGIVGFTLLDSLLKSSHLNRLKILLIEQSKKPSTFTQPPRNSERSHNSEWDSLESDNAISRKFSNRVSSITQSSRLAFENIGLWNTVKPYAKDVRYIKVWNYNYFDNIIFEQNVSNRNSKKEYMFHVVENNRLLLALLNSIYTEKQADDSILWNHSLSHLNESSSQGLVDVLVRGNDTADEYTLSAPLVLGCDGFKSKVREFSRMKYQEFGLNKTAVVGTVKMSALETDPLKENNVAYQRFSNERDTVAALLPLDNEYSSFVISAPDELAKYLLECDETTFIEEFNSLLSRTEQVDNVLLKGLHGFTNSTYEWTHDFMKAVYSLNPNRMQLDTSDVIGSREPPSIDSLVQGSRAKFPLVFGTTSPKMLSTLPGKLYPQIALLGDSAHRVHPLAGQGLNLGIQDVVELVKQFEKVVSIGEKLFDEKDLSQLSRTLKKFECRRQSYIVPISAGILGMQYLFKVAPTSMLKSVNKCDYIKSRSVRIANGC